MVASANETRVRIINLFIICSHIQLHPIINSYQSDTISLYQTNSSSDSFQRLSDEYNTSVKNLQRWFSDGVDRKPGCGRKKLNQLAEEQLQNWILEESLKKGRRVKRYELKEHAIFLFNNPLFKASKAWQDEFIKNHNIKYRVNELLFQHGLLNSMQQNKFLAQQAKKEEEILKQQIVEQTKKREELEQKSTIKVEFHGYLQEEEKSDNHIPLIPITTSAFNINDEDLFKNEEPYQYIKIEENQFFKKQEDSDSIFRYLQLEVEENQVSYEDF